MQFSHPAFLYYYIGVLVTLFCVWWYRPQGESQKSNELYLAVIGPIIWPLLILKFFLDRVLDRIQYQRDRKFHAWIEEHLVQLNVDYNKYCAFMQTGKSGYEIRIRSFLAWCRSEYDFNLDVEKMNTKIREQ